MGRALRNPSPKRTLVKNNRRYTYKLKTPFIMKKLILALAAVALLGTAAQAQKINKEALLQKIEKNRYLAQFG